MADWKENVDIRFQRKSKLNSIILHIPNHLLPAFYFNFRFLRQTPATTADYRFQIARSSSCHLKNNIRNKAVKMADYTFGPHKIDHNDVFYTTDLLYAFVNLRPVLPGHILNSSITL
ncbi:unnamed protein product [Lactuca saligna]|uniref:Uncharacterized protein n=1 Tax=Lactuca saligna TaxID=75948 RepID=A0AA35Y4F2_LACSI|nr:unnamed protein product [Lactuca saligna]